MTTVLPLLKGKIALTTGTITLGPNHLVHCDADGTFTIIWKDETTTAAITLITGDDRSIPDGAAITITAGTFTVA